MNGQPMYKPAQRDSQSGFLPAMKGAEVIVAAKPGRASAARVKADLPPPAALVAGSLARQDTLYQRVGKRLTDIVGSAVALVLCLPFIPLIALVIKLNSRGPILYRSIRLGQHQKPFIFYKFRSMVDGAHESRNFILHLNEAEGPVFKIANDPRVTLIGRFLRRTSIDELPQLINVLRGDMSLVGPRPPIPEEVEKYEPWQRRRLDVKPGITCLWQISGRSKLGFDEWMRLDIQYIQHQSFLLDLKILLRTIPAVLSRDGAY
jgi:exopolysaccharide biosynthesis polyprenyl glycosylphosphotransferase